MTTNTNRMVSTDNANFSGIGHDSIDEQKSKISQIPEVIYESDKRQ